MSIANDLNDVVEGIWRHAGSAGHFADHIPDEWITAAAALSEKGHYPPTPLYLLIWSCGSSWMAFFRNEPISRSLGASTSVQKGWPMMPCSRTVPCLRPVSDSANSRSSGCSNVRRCVGRERYPEDHWHGLQVFAIDGALFPEPRICLNSEHISARVTPQPTGRHPTRCCGWSRS